MKYFAFLIVLQVILMASCSESSAQRTQRFGINTGLNLSKMKLAGPGVNESYTKTHAGIYLGVSGEFFLSNSISFETGLGFSNKGYNYEGPVRFTFVTYNGKFKTNLLYLDIPMSFKAYFPMKTESSKFYLLFGPYMGIGVSGKHKLEVKDSRGVTLYDKIPVEWGSSNTSGGEYKRFDFGWTLGTGFEFGAVQLGINYAIGSSNIAVGSNDEAKNRTFAFVLVYKFNKES
ncbi:porin family protein [Reichenbachiella sp.]|uniref:porin family protein n=1 Tax=Reichenbachiella sp. TaxID=2184521 RepID=UPI0032983E56